MPPKEAPTPWHSYRLRPANEGDAPVGWYGGHPRGVKAHAWPRCAVCGNPMCHMAQFSSGPWLDLGPFRRMSVFICHATGGRCEDWDPSKGANRVLLHPRLDDDLYDGPPTVRVYRRMPLSIDRAVDERKLITEARRRGKDISAVLSRLRHDKLGGGAVWLYGDATPKSATGRGKMRLVAQLTTELVSFDITPKGMAYVFVDPHNPTDMHGAMVWQSGS